MALDNFWLWTLNEAVTKEIWWYSWFGLFFLVSLLWFFKKIRKDQNAVTRVTIRNEHSGGGSAAAFQMGAYGNSWMLQCGSNANDSNAFTIRVDGTSNSNTGTERFRLTTAGAIGLNGTNYGSSGQVLTSQGSSSAPTWTTISSDLVSDTSPQLGGNLETNSNDILFADNDSAKFGAGTDLEIYHDPTSNDSFIKEAGSGALKVCSNLFRVNNAANTEAMIKAEENAGVTLSYDANTKFETTSSGVDVTGNITMDAVPGTNTNAALPVLFQTSAGVIDGGSQLTYNPGGDVLKVNGLTLSSSQVRTSGSNALQLTTANANGTVDLYVRTTHVECNGNFLPQTNNTDNLGSSSYRWANLYTQDLQLSNEAKKDTGGNDVDGTWGDWTLQEGEYKIYMINNRTGKKYSLKMEEE